jgi:hypothetical protein
MLSNMQKPRMSHQSVDDVINEWFASRPNAEGKRETVQWGVLTEQEFRSRVRREYGLHV